MLLVKTYQLNCKSKEVATPQNDTIRFDHFTLWPHCTFMSALCYSFWKAQLLYQDGTINEPRKICILVSEHILNIPAKPQNKSKSIDTLDWFLNNIEPPKCGLIVSVYSVDNKMRWIEDRWSAQCIWPLKKEWQWKGGGKYITLQDSEPNVSVRKQEMVDNHPTRETILNIDNISFLPVKRINYTMSEEEIFTLLKYSHLNLSYHGGTYYTAGMIGCPTIGLYWDHHPKILARYHEDNMDLTDVYVEHTSWNLGIANSKARVLQYDYETVKHRPQSYLKHVTTNVELLTYLKGYSDFEVNGKVYDIVS